jgi:hypothetical protein
LPAHRLVAEGGRRADRLHAPEPGSKPLPACRQRRRGNWPRRRRPAVGQARTSGRRHRVADRLHQRVHRGELVRVHQCIRDPVQRGGIQRGRAEHRRRGTCRGPRRATRRWRPGRAPDTRRSPAASAPGTPGPHTRPDRTAHPGDQPRPLDQQLGPPTAARSPAPRKARPPAPRRPLPTPPLVVPARPPAGRPASSRQASAPPRHSSPFAKTHTDEEQVGERDRDQPATRDRPGAYFVSRSTRTPRTTRR